MLSKEIGKINGEVRFVELGNYYKFKVNRPYKDKRLMVHVTKTSVKDKIIEELSDGTLVEVEGFFKPIGNTKYRYLQCKKLSIN